MREQRVATGVRGFDEATSGGLPEGRFTIVFGSAGSGKTIFALQTLASEARQGRASLFVTFEESPPQLLADNAAFSWSQDLRDASKVVFVDAQISQSVIIGGEFDLEGLLAMLQARATQIGARVVVLDGLDVLLENMTSPTLVRREMFRIREWLTAGGLTGIITAKAGVGVTAYEYLEFVADCAITMHHRLQHGVASRWLRVSKYRGQAHSSDELTFTIGRTGLAIAGDTSPVLAHAVSSERVSSGVERLDTMLGGGYYRGSSVLFSGAPGTTKTSLATAFAEAACKRGEPTIYVSFDEAPAQIVRNVASIGIDLGVHVHSGALTMLSLRARAANPESHVATVQALLQSSRVKNLVIDPISALGTSDDATTDRAALQLLDIAKSLGITTVVTSLLSNATPISEATMIGISTIADTWIHVSYLSHAGERNRALTIIKSRGMNHSNQVRELVLSSSGITLSDPYMSGGEVLMGTLRWERELEDQRLRELEVDELAERRRQAEIDLAESRSRLSSVQAELAARETALERLDSTRQSDTERIRLEKSERATRRGGRTASPVKRGPA